VAASGPPAERPADRAEVLDTTVASILRQAAARAPGTVGLVDPAANPRRRWTYADMLAEAERVSLALRARFAPGERIAVYAPSLVESLLLTYGAALARMVLVPVNPALRPAELAHVVGQSGAAGIFLTARWRDQDLHQALRSVRSELPELRRVVDFADWAAFCAPAPDDVTAGAADPAGLHDPDDPAPDDVAQIVYTSGTTGAPKGAMLTHRGMTNAARLGAMRFTMTAGDIYLQAMPLFHVGGQVVSLQICQQLATAVLLPSFDPAVVLELVESERITLTCGVPTMLLALAEHPDFTRRDLSSLRAVSSGGAVVPTELVRRIESALGVRFAIVFGQTEACGFISQTELDDDDEVKAQSLGRPLPSVEVRVVDEARHVVELGQVGELEVRGPNTMVGYHALDEASAEVLGPDGWLRTGDLVDMDGGGVLRMRGRRKDMIVSGGENVFPVEVEEALATHPAVAQAAVLGVPDRRWGEAVVAVVRPVPGAEVDAEALAAHLRLRLAPYKVPKRWEFVDELPLTASGKVQKYVLRDRFTA